MRFTSSEDDLVDWIGGFYFFGQDLKRGGFQQLNNLAPVFGVPFGHRENSSAEQKILSGSLFGDSTWQLRPRLDLLAPDLDLSQSETAFNASPRIGVSYALTPEAQA